MDPLVQGSLVQAGGALLGGLLSDQDPPGLKYVRSASRASTKGGMEGAIRTGQKFGLHPLASIGSAQGYSVPYGGSSNPMGPAIENAASAVGQGIASKADKAVQDKQLQLMDAQIAETRSRTLLNSGNARRAFYGPVPAVTGAAGGLEGLDQGPIAIARAHPRGLRREPTPDLGARQKVTLGKHEAVGPNPEAFEVGLSELLTGAMIYGTQWAYQAIKELEDGTRPKKRRTDYGTGDFNAGATYGPGSSPR